MTLCIAEQASARFQRPSGQQDGEGIAPDPAHGRGWPGDMRQSVGNLAQSRVAGRVPQTGVELLEVVTVEDRDTHGFAAISRALDGGFEGVEKVAPTGRAREQVAIRQVADLA